jgi:ribosome biogenesis GTPase / thiamine phosphate phosphatase
MEGIVYKSTGSWYSVRAADGLFWNARIKGKLKIDEEISSTNPVAVGDKVLFEPEYPDTDNRTGVISDVSPRNNYMVRVSPHNPAQKHIIASNIDLALLVASIADPRTSTGFIDRFLVTAEAYHIPAILVVNKMDILKPKHKEVLAVWEDIYGRAGYDVYPVTATDRSTLMPLIEKLRGKVTLFSGHSGVGKSTLINQLIPGIGVKTNVVSGWSGKGQHTTTFAEMFDMPAGEVDSISGSGCIIDTPGVKEFGLIDIERELLSHYFPEMRTVLTQCKFNNCQHINEPGCAVKKAVIAKAISEERYVNYTSILESIEKEW